MLLSSMNIYVGMRNATLNLMMCSRIKCTRVAYNILLLILVVATNKGELLSSTNCHVVFFIIFFL